MFAVIKAFHSDSSPFLLWYIGCFSTFFLYIRKNDEDDQLDYVIRKNNIYCCVLVKSVRGETLFLFLNTVQMDFRPIY